MKPKFIDKKLRLSKKTIADLNNSELNKVYGGVTETETRVWTVCRTKCASNCASCGYSYCKEAC